MALPLIDNAFMFFFNQVLNMTMRRKVSPVHIYYTQTKPETMNTTNTIAEMLASMFHIGTYEGIIIVYFNYI